MFPDLELLTSLFAAVTFPLRSSLFSIFILSLTHSIFYFSSYAITYWAEQLSFGISSLKRKSRRTKQRDKVVSAAKPCTHTLNNGLNAYFPQHEPCNVKNFTDIDCVVGRHKAVPSESRWYLCRSYCFISVGWEKWQQTFIVVKEATMHCNRWRKRSWVWGFWSLMMPYVIKYLQSLFCKCCFFLQL